jgi:hypothetical protein
MICLLFRLIGLVQYCSTVLNLPDMRTGTTVNRFQLLVAVSTQGCQLCIGKFLLYLGLFYCTTNEVANFLRTIRVFLVNITGTYRSGI